MKKLLLATLLTLPLLNATTMLVVRNDHNVMVAADSLKVIHAPNFTSIENTCKINTINGSVLMITGLVQGTSYDGYRLSESILSDPNSSIDSVVAAMLPQLENLILLLHSPYKKGDVVIDLVQVKPEASSVNVRMRQVFFDTSDANSVSFRVTSTDFLPNHNFITLGEHEVMDEYLAKHNVKKWNAKIINQLVESQVNNKTVGGPIRIMNVTPNGKTWIQNECDSVDTPLPSSKRSILFPAIIGADTPKILVTNNVVKSERNVVALDVYASMMSQDSGLESLTTTKMITLNRKHIVAETQYHNELEYNTRNGKGISLLTTGEYGVLFAETKKELLKSDVSAEKTSLNGKSVMVLTYRIEKENSKWSIKVSDFESDIAGYQVRVYVAADLTVIKIERGDLQSTIKWTVDYQVKTFGGQSITVPMSSSYNSKIGAPIRETINFIEYKQFKTDTNIRY